MSCLKSSFFLLLITAFASNHRFSFKSLLFLHIVLFLLFLNAFFLKQLTIFVYHQFITTTYCPFLNLQCVKKADFNELSKLANSTNADLYYSFPSCCAVGLAWKQEHLTCVKDDECVDSRDRCPDISTTSKSITFSNSHCHLYIIHTTRRSITFSNLPLMYYKHIRRSITFSNSIC